MNFLASALRLVTPGEAAKDASLAGLGFVPAYFTPQVTIGLVFGVLQLAAVVYFRYRWLRHQIEMDRARLRHEIEMSRQPERAAESPARALPPVSFDQ
jgi:hypothetical protein